MKIVFMGTPQIAVLPLEHLINASGIEVLAVVTQPDRPSGRGHKLTAPPVKILAQEKGIKVFQTESIRKDSELLEILRDFAPDYLITVAFGQILSQEVLDIPKLGTINLHASLLPEYRGANPLQRAIAEGKKVTGVTTMLTVLALDAGDMLLTKEIEITDEMTTPELAAIVSQSGGEILEKTILGYADGSIVPQIQDESKVTFAHKFKKEDGALSFDVEALGLHNKIRGFLPSPSVSVGFGSERIKLLKSSIVDEVSMGNVGEILKISKYGIEIQTKKGIILIEKLQPPGKKAMNAFDWANGAKIKLNQIFE